MLASTLWAEPDQSQLWDYFWVHVLGKPQEGVFPPSERLGILVLNTPWIDAESLRNNLPLAFCEMVVQRKAMVYNIDAAAVDEKFRNGADDQHNYADVYFQLSWLRQQV